MAFFDLRGRLSPRQKLQIEIGGLVVFILAWWLVYQLGIFRKEILPSPFAVVASLPEMHFQDALLRNLGYSLKLNVLGYIEAVVIALPLGYVIGLNKYVRALTERVLTAFRYLPVTALTALLIAMFGITLNAKVQFLTLGILVYLIGAVVSRVDEVEQVYDDTAVTLGATRWQRVTSIFLPAALSRIWTDIINLVPITWTYIVVAEGFNLNHGGVGAMAVNVTRASRPDKLYAILIIILLVGILQDKIMIWADKKMFRYKYAES